MAEEDIQPLDKSRLEKRQKLIEKGDFSDEMFRYAKQFAQADDGAGRRENDDHVIMRGRG